MVMPTGWLKSAAVPVPSVEPEVPAIPAKVVTSPDAVLIARMVLLPVSVTKRDGPSVTTPMGVWNVAAVPVPSAEPEVPAIPAKVVTTPDEITTFRTVLLPIRDVEVSPIW
jgi:hypothetical protein